MKKDRNCGNMYPVYPMMPTPGMGPAMVPNIMGPNMAQGMMNGQPSPTNIDIINNNQDDDLSQIKRQLSSLENRVSRLESSLNNNSFNSYNDSNYYVL